MREYEDIRPDLYIAWPDRPYALRLTPNQRGLSWEHQHRGHDKIYAECYACVCEDAY